MRSTHVHELVGARYLVVQHLLPVAGLVHGHVHIATTVQHLAEQRTQNEVSYTNDPAWHGRHCTSQRSSSGRSGIWDAPGEVASV
jgi:UDP-2,3-diacylglucosamine pyrophosphatase LpxH